VFPHAGWSGCLVCAANAPERQNRCQSGLVWNTLRAITPEPVSLPDLNDTLAKIAPDDAQRKVLAPGKCRKDAITAPPETLA
jgi:hypothetical protein